MVRKVYPKGLLRKQDNKMWKSREASLWTRETTTPPSLPLRRYLGTYKTAQTLRISLSISAIFNDTTDVLGIS